VDEKNILAQRNCWEEKYIELGYTEQTPHEGKKSQGGGHGPWPFETFQGRNQAPTGY
jgi:hypothetical protein